MFLYRLMVPIFILSYFGVIKCITFDLFEYKTEPGDIEKAYLNEVVRKDQNKEENHSICTKPVTDKDKMQVLTACTATLFKFRKVYERIKRRLYVYYNYYENLDYLCKTGTVELHRYRKGKTYKQALIPCYITLPVVETSFLNPGITEIDTLPKSDLFNRFLIFPTDDEFSSWLVFDYIESKKKHVLIKWYQTKHIELVSIPTSILIFPPPTKTRDVSEIYAILYPFLLNWDIVTNERHVLHRVTSAQLQNLCIKISKTTLRSIKVVRKPFSSYYPLMFRSTKAYEYDRVPLITEGYSCDEYLVDKGWVLFTAPGDDAIILGQLYASDEDLYVIDTYVKNVNYQFYHYII